jgi:hypothetical protein
MTNKSLISGPVFVASSSTTNPNINNNVEFLNDFNKIHERNSQLKHLTQQQQVNLFKNKSYSFLMSKEFVRKVNAANATTSYSNSVKLINNKRDVHHNKMTVSNTCSSISSSTNSSLNQSYSNNFSTSLNNSNNQNQTAFNRPNFVKIKTSLA